MTRLEARERLIARINQRREEITRTLTQQQPRERTSPAAHYHISTNPTKSYDMTAWLSDLGDDPAIKVSFDLIVVSYLLILASRTSFPDLKITCWAGFVVSTMLVMRTSSPMTTETKSFSLTTNCTNTASYGSTTRLTISGGSKILSTRELTLTS